MIFKADGTTLPVVEHFGPTIQGEGAIIGQKTYFVRFGGCDYACSWCDSKFSWDGSIQPTVENGLRKTPMDLASDIIEKLRTPDGKFVCDHLTLSGGNPAVHGTLMGEFLTIMKAYGFKFSMETQGTAYQDSWFNMVDHIVVSPKPPSSKMNTNWGRLEYFMHRLQAQNIPHSLKVVIMEESDLDYLRSIIRLFPEEEVIYASVGNPTPYVLEPVSNMLIRKLGWLWDVVIKDPEFNKVRPLPQTHVLVYENRRGV